MDISSITLTRTIPVSQIVRAQNSTSRIALPVEKNQYLYAQLKHVYGMPSNSDGQGYTLSKLRALDNLLERLGRLGPQEKHTVPSLGEKISSAKVDSLIDKFAGDLHRMSVEGGTAGYTSVNVEPGLLFNMLV
jgi:hypothetical protein